MSKDAVTDSTKKITKTNLPELTNKVFLILSGVDAEERNKIIKATLALCGDPVPVTRQISSSSDDSKGGIHPEYTPEDAQKFFNDKQPKNKGEQLAVAARFLELTAKRDSNSKDSLKGAIVDARRNFDDRNFPRDMNNAKIQAGFFNTGGSRNEFKLSYYGQQFVDALPDRTAVKNIRRPKVGGKKGKTV